MTETNNFARNVMQLTSSVIPTESFFEAVQEKMLSVLGRYIETEKQVSNFQEMIYEAYDLLRTNSGWYSLSQSLLSTKNSKLKADFDQDDIFQAAEAINNSTILGITNRLELFLERNH